MTKLEEIELFKKILISYYRIQHLSLKALIPRSIDVSVWKGKSKNVLGEKNS